MESKTHWRNMRNPKYLGAYDLKKEQDTLVTITNVEKVFETFQGRDEKAAPVLTLKEYSKKFWVNLTNGVNIEKALKETDPQNWIGKKISLYVKHINSFGGTDCIRVRPIAPKLEKDKLLPERFEAMRKAIKAGQFSVEAAKQKFALTPEQLGILEGGKNV